MKICSQCGFIVNPVFPWLGASPDFLVNDVQETSHFGNVEIKCPFSKKDTCIEQACEDQNFFLGLSNGKVSLKKKHVYYYQLQGLMATLQLQWSGKEQCYQSLTVSILTIYFKCLNLGNV